MITNLISRLPKHMQTMIVTVLILFVFILWVTQNLTDNKMQRQINFALSSNQSINLNTLLPNAKMICIVPKDTQIYNDTTGIYDYLSKARLQSLNKRLISLWQIVRDDWHLIAINDNNYKVYRMGDMIEPNFYGAKCQTTNQPMIISADISTYGKKFNINSAD